jgi:hypothetical protein
MMEWRERLGCVAHLQAGANNSSEPDEARMEATAAQHRRWTDGRGGGPSARPPGRIAALRRVAGRTPDPALYRAKADEIENR